MEKTAEGTARQENGMELKLTELTDKAEVCAVYEIYRHCMFQPDREKFNRKAAQFLVDKAIKILGCFHQNKIVGVLVISLIERRRAEIIGIAVDASARNRGVGSYMIHQAMRDYGLDFVFAETDDDAVAFYRKNGFRVARFAKSYDGETAVRYRCEWTKASC